MKKINRYILYFLSFSFIGYLWEVLLQFIRHHKFINCGTLLGPWLPIYGWGGLLVSLLPKKINDNYLVLFIISFILCGVMEYMTSVYLENVYNMKWWDYSSYPFNINGRIFLGGLIIFALASVIAVKLVIPFLDKIYDKYNSKLFAMVLIILLIIHIIDFVYCTYKPNTAKATIATIQHERR